MGFVSNIGKLFAQTAKQSTSSQGMSAEQAEPVGAAIRSEKESPSESSLAVAQSLWSRGNLSPLDALFGATAIVKLVPTAGFGFIGNHLGHRLRKYADDTGVTVDAAEADPVLTRLYAKNKSSIMTTEWKPDAFLFKKNRHQVFIALRPSALCGPLEIAYSQCVSGLKLGGRLFAADLMESKCGDADAFEQKYGSRPGGRVLRSCDEHVSILKSVGFDIECKCDLTENLLAAVRNGFFQSLEMLEELCALDKINRIQRTRAFAEQLGIWKEIYGLAAARKIEVTGILANRVK